MKWNSPSKSSTRQSHNTPTTSKTPVRPRFDQAKKRKAPALKKETHSEKAPFKNAPLKATNSAKPVKGKQPVKFVPKPVIDDDRRVYGIHAVSATLAYMPERAKKLYYIESNARIAPLIELARKIGIIVEQSARQIFDVNYGTDIVHQGVMLVTTPYPYSDLDDALRRKPQLVIVLDGVEDPRNLGRGARSAFALGAQLLIIPANRAAAVSASAEKAAVGTLARIPVAQVTNLNQAIEKLKKAGLWVVGAAGEATTPLWKGDFSRPTALVIGSEESGLRKLVRENCDELVTIPMTAQDMSLNAADALTIMLYEVKRQRAI